MSPMSDTRAIEILEREKLELEHMAPAHPACQPYWRDKIYALNLAIGALREREALRTKVPALLPTSAELYKQLQDQATRFDPIDGKRIEQVHER